MEVTIRKMKKEECFPCQMLGSIIEEMQDELQAEGVQVVEHDVIDEPEIASKYGLMGVPVLIFERDGKEVTRRTGMIAREEILYIISQVKEGA